MELILLRLSYDQVPFLYYGNNLPHMEKTSVLSLLVGYH